MIQKPFAVIPLALSAITTGNERAESPAMHIGVHRSAGLAWQSNGASNVWVRGQLPSAQSIDFVAMLAANALPGTLIRVRLGTSQAQVDGGSAPYDSGAVSFITPAATRDNALYNSHLEIGAAVTASWWRIDITGHTGDFSVSHLVIGKRLSPMHFYDRGFERGVEDLGGVDMNRWGVVTQEDGIILRTLNFKLSWLSEDEYETMFGPMLEKLGKRGVCYWCFDPEPTAYRQRATYFGRFGQNLTAVNVPKPKTFAIEFSIKSMI